MECSRMVVTEGPPEYKHCWNICSEKCQNLGFSDSKVKLVEKEIYILWQ